MGDWLVPRLVPWLNKMSALQSTPGEADAVDSGSAQTTWDMPELDAADKELSIWSGGKLKGSFLGGVRSPLLFWPSLVSLVGTQC